MHFWRNIKPFDFHSYNGSLISLHFVSINKQKCMRAIWYWNFKGSSVKDARKDTEKSTPLPLSAFVRIGPYSTPPCGRLLWMTPNDRAQCGLRGCKNWPAPFPGRMSYKATKPGLAVCHTLACFFIVWLFIRAPFYVLLVFIVCVLFFGCSS